MQTDRLFNVGPGSRELIAFVFFSTICSYSFHWYLTDRSALPSPRINWLNRHRYVHVILFFTGLAGAAWYFLSLIDYWPWLLTAAAGAFLYSAPKIPHPLFRSLRRVAVGKTIFLAFVWMYVTTILPVVVSGSAWNIPLTCFIIYRFFLVYAICILFDYRDRIDDRAAGIRSLVTFMSEKNITRLFFTSLALAVAASACMVVYGFSVLQAAVLVIPCIITALLYEYARKNFPDMFYYLVLDGLMALSAVLMLVAGI
jgi:4-hydroxybenzoate polyprenyltransferase